MNQNIQRWFREVYHQLVEINDTPFRKAAGLGLGVFLGIFPGTGPIAAVVLAVALRVNRAAALLANLLTNSWLSIATFVLAAKAGGAITGTSWENIYHSSKEIVRHFNFKHFFDFSILNIIWPLLIGYLAVGLALGVIVYIVAYAVLKLRK